MARLWFLATAIEFALIQAAHVHFALELTWHKGSPNGFERDMIFVNDMFPGPPLIMDEGDKVTVSFKLIRI